MEQWVLLRKGADFEAIGKEFGISPRLSCLIRNRGVVGMEAVRRYLNGTITDLYDGMLMKDMSKAVEILREKIDGGSKIRVIGDYDIDGVNATYILLKGLQMSGADVDSDIPDRIKDGYGLNVELIERAFRDKVDTIVTCDNGIAAGEEIAYGKRLGMTVIVTDHHEVPYEEQGEERKYLLPAADAVIDPKQPGCEYPFKGLCGAAIAYKLMEALYEARGNDADELDDLLENVAVATVGDVMDLEGENRILVKEGLERLRRTSNHGLSALIDCTGVDRARLNTYHIGFVLGPCLNAGGRLDTAKRALDLLCAKNKKEADILAGDLKALNDSRKDMTQAAVDEAVKMIEETSLIEDRVLAVYLPDCHESLAGIVAGRLRERYCRPAFVMTDAEDGVKGSGRSIEAYHMYEALTQCRELLTKFGGHKLAAGFSLRRENVERFRKMLNENCTLTEQEMREKVVIDMEMPFSAVTESFVRELKYLEPFGKGNTKPVFAARKVELLSGQIIGKNKNVLRMNVKDAGGTVMEAIYFGDTERLCTCLEERYGAGALKQFLGRRQSGMMLSVTYYPEVNEYMGSRKMQIVITHYQCT